MHTMRKLFALAVMALALASFAAGCGKKAEETPSAAPSSMSSDSTATGGAMDSTSMMSADSTKHK